MPTARPLVRVASAAMAWLAAAAIAGAQPAPRRPLPRPPAPPAMAADRADYPFYPLAFYWSFPFELRPAAPPATDGTRLFVAWTNGNVSAVDMTTGRPITARRAPTTLPPVVDRDTLLITGDGAVEGLRTADLEPRWQTPLPAKAAFAPVVRSGWAFLPLDNGALTALRGDTGAVVWTTPVGPPAIAPIVEGDRLYAGTTGGAVHAIGVTDGATAWQTLLEGDATALAAVEGHLFVATTGRWLYALDSRRGRVRWRYRIQGAAIGLVVDEDRVIAVMLDQTVRAFKVGSGAQVWRQELSFRPVGGPVIAGRSILVTGFAPAIRILDRKTGANQGLYPVPLPAEPGGIMLESLVAGPLLHIGATVFDDVVVLATQHGWLHAARRGFDPPATPVTAMPGAPLPLPAPPPGWTPPAAAPDAPVTAPASQAAPPATAPAPATPPRR